MTASEASTLRPGDRVEFSDPALEFSLSAGPWHHTVGRAGRAGVSGEHEVGISWEGVPAVSQDPAADFDHVRKVAP